jgi:hypothetical protein
MYLPVTNTGGGSFAPYRLFSSDCRINFHNAYIHIAIIITAPTTPPTAIPAIAPDVNPPPELPALPVNASAEKEKNVIIKINETEFPMETFQMSFKISTVENPFSWYIFYLPQTLHTYATYLLGFLIIRSRFYLRASERK